MPIEQLAIHRETVNQIHIDKDLKEYIVDLVTATRTNPNLALGASPRGSLALYRAAQALALINERDYVIPDDIKQLINPVLNHRIILKADASLKGYTEDSILRAISNNLNIPIEKHENDPD